MKEVILITGANGLIAKALSQKLKDTYSLRFLTRKKKRENEFEWEVDKGIIDEQSVIGVHHIIHLAGANLAEKRWTKERKREIISSRVDGANLLLKALIRTEQQLQSFISASAVGFYGTETTERIFQEEDPRGTDFLSEVVFQWEQVADQFMEQQKAKRVVNLRTGVVLSNQGGALLKLVNITKLNMGAVLGNGKQYMPWIHIDDLCSLFEMAVKENNMDGVYNAVSPNSTTNRELTSLIAKTLHKPILFPPIPAFILKLIFGKASILLLAGSRASAEKIKKAGFTFKYPTLPLALSHLISKPNPVQQSP